MEEDGLILALTPVQLAAVLAQESITEQDTSSNRVWGSIGVVAGVFELIGAGLLLAAPEPTMATKAGGVVLGTHGVDTVQSSARQVWTGHETRSFTSESAAALARGLGADDVTADRIGTGIDIAVPIVVSLGVGAARVLAIRGGRVSLAAHEATSTAHGAQGGHTIARHVGMTEAQLRARLASQLNIPVASSFKSLSVAENVISKALAANKTQIAQWAQTAVVNQKLVINYQSAGFIGAGVVRATNLLTNFSKVRIVLKMGSYGGKPYYILTAFPVP